MDSDAYRDVSGGRCEDGRRTYDDIKERFPFDVERYVLDDDGGGYDLIVADLGRGGDGEGTQGGRATGRGEIRVVVWGEGAIFGDHGGVFEPLLWGGEQSGEGRDWARTLGRPPRAAGFLRGDDALMRGLYGDCV